ncbi:MAG: M20 family metallo-hydrolase [Prevotella sp.]|nr:M20 family metallo-hydrolase [Prevotella sp.]
MTTQQLTDEALSLLQRLIAVPSVSRDETAAADLLFDVMTGYGLNPSRKGNNVWCLSSKWDDEKDIILLNAHIDTVKPVSTWTRDPFSPVIEEGRLYGLGSNDCGGGLVALLQVFRELTSRPEQCYNFVYLASCEEEVSGVGGIRSVISDSPLSSLFSKSSGITAVVGEPTGMQPAIAERGLMVLDGISHGKSGHAARGEGINAIHKALDDLLFIRDYHFEKTSPLLGDTKMQCTVINSGTQHNVVPDECRFIVDVRTNEYYTNEEVLEFLQGKLKSTLTARSTHLRSSHIPESNPLVQKCIAMGMTPFGSPTLSDQALMPIPSFKLGPGQSARSHSADEYICISEISDAIEKYLHLLS